MYLLTLDRNGETLNLQYDEKTGKLTGYDDLLVPRPFGKPKPSTSFPQGSVVKGKRRAPERLRIQMGLSCNYDCSYCLQAMSRKLDHRSGQDVDAFLEKLDRAIDVRPIRQIEFWGGEPLLYWKKILKIATWLREQGCEGSFLMITNGALLTEPVVDKLDELGFSIGISHDGPGQPARGPDPFETNYKGIEYACSRLGRFGRLSFNVTLTHGNHSLRKVAEWFDERAPKPFELTTEGMADLHPLGELETLSQSEANAISQEIARDILDSTGLRFGSVSAKLRALLTTFESGLDRSLIESKCGVHRPEQLIVDLSGKVLTCQNYTPETDTIGMLDTLDRVSFDRGHHWSSRLKCGGCLVFHSCQGGCIRLDHYDFERSCNNNWAFNFGIFVAALAITTDGGMLIEWSIA